MRTSPNFCTKNLRAISDTLDLIGGKWKLLILITLQSGGHLRFGELQRTIGGITPRVLSKELKDLEQNGMVEREVLPTAPVAVRYSLTPYGQTLEGVLVALAHWGQVHRQLIMAPVVDPTA